MQTAILILLAVTMCAALVAAVRSFRKPLEWQLRFEVLEKAHEATVRTVREEMAQNRKETGEALQNFAGSLVKRMMEVGTLQKEQLELLRSTVGEHLKNIQQDNNQKLEAMRRTVDEKLHATLEQRLGESFKQVSERLEKVHQGLGEMKSLAHGVGDLKKVLSNVKTRGTLGEVQLHNLLEELLTPDQYERNVVTRQGSAGRVEFAIRLPGSNDRPLWLPIDAKFPHEDYVRLVEAQEKGDRAAIDEASRLLDRTLVSMAKLISGKYLDPPHTTDFAIMYLANEAAYASVLSRPLIFETLQRDYKVILAGPTTISALLSALSLGFRTLTIEKRTSDVWRLLGAIKTEFDVFGVLLDKTRKKLDEASSSIDTAAVRQRAITRKLKGVEQVGEVEAELLLGLKSESSVEEPVVTEKLGNGAMNV